MLFAVQNGFAYELVPCSDQAICDVDDLMKDMWNNA